MNVPRLVTITVVLIQPVLTPLVASLVPVTRATVEMDYTVWVSSSSGFRHVDSLLLQI